MDMGTVNNAAVTDATIFGISALKYYKIDVVTRQIVCLITFITTGSNNMQP